MIGTEKVLFKYDATRKRYLSDVQARLHGIFFASV